MTIGVTIGVTEGENYNEKNEILCYNILVIYGAVIGFDGKCETKIASRRRFFKRKTK